MPHQAHGIIRHLLWLLLLGAGSANATQPLEVAWMAWLETSAYEDSGGIVIDAQGDIIITGSTLGAFDGVFINAFDAVTAKFDDTGERQWLHQLNSGGSFDHSLAAAADPLGSSYIAGHTRGWFEEPLGQEDGYVAKYDVNGNLAWVRQFGTSSIDRVYGAVSDSEGNIFVSGETRGDFAASNLGSFDAFVRKYDSNGNVTWTRQFGTAQLDRPSDLTADTNGHIVTVGVTGGHLDGTSAGGDDAFVRKYDSDGNQLWSRQFGTTSHDRAASLTADTAANLIVVGSTSGSLEGDNAGYDDAYVRKFDSNGNVLWTRQFGTDTYDYATDVVTDSTGAVYVAGQTWGDLAASNAGHYDVFVRKYTAAGTLVWTYQQGTDLSDQAAGIAIDDSGNLYLTGVDGATTGSVPYPDYDIFLVKLTPVAVPILSGDANNDGVVDAVDFLAVESNMGAIGTDNGSLLGDANDDGRVDGDDWVWVEQHFGDVWQPIAPPTPEPGVAGFVLFGLLLRGYRRRGGLGR